MPSQADKVLEYMNNRVTEIMTKNVQAVADAIQEELHELTPKRTGKTAKAWTQEKQDDGSIVIHTRLETGDPARWLLELNYGNADQAPTMFIQRAIARGLKKVNNGGDL